MQVKQFTFNPFQENSYILYDHTGEGVVIDPGCSDREEREELTSFIEENGIKPVHLLNTHAHIDHILGNQYVANKFKLKLALHPKDLPTLKMAAISAKMYGIPYEESPEPELELKEGKSIHFGETELEVILLPGHAPGHVLFHHVKSKQIIGGDVLFRGSIGRTDLPGGNHRDLIEGIQNKLFTLDPEIVVYPGHGPETTIGYEKANNPFF